MKLHPRLAAVSALVFSLSFHAASSSRASVFDWNNFTYSGATVTPTDKNTLGTSTDGTNTLSLQYTLNNTATFSTAATSPIAASNTTNTTYYTDGGNSTTQKYLQTVADFANNTQNMTITLFFAKPVVGLSFTIFDVDSNTAGTYQDDVSAIMGLNVNGSSVNPQSLANIGTGATNTIVGTTEIKAVSGSSAAQNSNNGNATVTFDSTAQITQISFTYGDVAPNTNHSNVQLIGLSNLTFADVPEPGTLNVLGLGTAGLGALAWLRRRK